ncbi:MAG: hypothetical protein K2O96_07315 [Lachnospiraceae bacterium]|nr:hypothetical protein [Lachnospiraceae bacterium]
MFIKRKPRNTEKDRIKALAKAKEQRRKRMMRTRYGQAPFRHSRNGMKSCIYLVLVVVSLLIMLVVSYNAQGQVNILMGFAGFFVLYLLYRGVASGISGFKERDKNYITCKIGTAGCALLFAGMCAIYVRGLF